MEVSSRLRGAALTAVGILVALGVVAVASRGDRPAHEVGATRAADILLDILFAFYLLGAALGAALVIYMMVIRRRLQHEGKANRSILGSSLGVFMFIVFGFLATRAILGRKPVVPPEALDPVIPGSTTTQVTTTSIDAATETPFAWVPVLVTLALLALAVAGWLWAGRRWRRARGELRAPTLAAALETAIDESLDDLRAEPDPRKAVIAAYARLERVLAQHGLPRKNSEAPLEYLHRMLAEVEVTVAAARRLTALFERAKFSQHEVGAEMKEEAIEALETVRDDLRAARAEAEHARQLMVGMPRREAGQ